MANFSCLIFLILAMPLAAVSESLKETKSKQSLSVELSDEVIVEYGGASRATFIFERQNDLLVPDSGGCKSFVLEAVAVNSSDNWNKRKDSEVKLELNPVCLSCPTDPSLGRKVVGSIQGPNLKGKFFEDLMQPPGKDVFGLHLARGVKGKAEISVTKEKCWPDNQTRDTDTKKQSN